MDEVKTLLEAQINTLTTERDEAKAERADVHAQAKATLEAKAELELVLEALKSKLMALENVHRSHSWNMLDSSRYFSLARDER